MNDAPWFPLAEGLRGISELLTEQREPTSDHSKIYRKLEEYSLSPEFNNYLVYLFAEGGDEFSIEVRQSAGLLLKNKIRNQFHSLPLSNRRYIQNSVVKALTLKSSILRQTASVVVSTLVNLEGTLQHWDGLIQYLKQGLMGSDEISKLAALDSLLKICEDSPEIFEAAFLTEEAYAGLEIVYLIQQQIAIQNSEIKKTSILIMNLILPLIPVSATQVLETYKQGLIQLLSSSPGDSCFLKELCNGLCQFLIFHEEILDPCIDSIVEFMLHCSLHPDQDIALEASEFWIAFLDSSCSVFRIRPILKSLIPILLKNMVYEDDDEAVISANQIEEQTGRPDQDSEIQPFTGSGPSFEDEVSGIWTLRKSSAAGLDKLSLNFGDDLLPDLLPLIEQRLNHEDWKVRESGILVLGAISEGCKEGLKPHLEQVLSFVLDRCEDQEPLVRVISCWVLSRYTQRVLMDPPKIHLIFQAIFRALQDAHKQVQQSACSALATIVEFGGEIIDAKANLILQNLAQVFWKYDRRNLQFAYDVISTLAQITPHTFTVLANREVILNPLLKQFKELPENDKTLPALLNCLGTLIIASGHGMSDLIPFIFNRSVTLISTDDDPIQVAALDLISSLLEALGPDLEILISQSCLLGPLLESCQKNEAEIKQSAFAVIGELAKIKSQQLKLHLESILMILVTNFGPEKITGSSLNATNNACWALGEISLFSTQMELQSVARISLENCIHLILNSRALPRILCENGAITLGRMSLHFAQDFSHFLHTFLTPWCEILRNIKDDSEKEQAFIGLFKMLRCNPEAGVHNFVSLCSAVASWSFGLSPELKQEIKIVLQSLKQQLEVQGEWTKIWNLVPSQIREKLDRPGFL